jgi:6,7-dimethyl-8-ribityllumazine synthase
MMMKPKDCISDYPTMLSETQKWSVDARGLRIAVVVARFHESITNKLLEGARKALEGAAHVDISYVPGAFELPYAALVLARKESDDMGYDAIVALGAVVRGDTPHFEYVAGEAARGLQLVALETGVPVAFGVLTTDTMEQAEARAGGSAGNKGYDAAMTAIEMARFGK